jgi:6-phosphogluconate dehydrogenase (decarboxylating)
MATMRSVPLRRRAAWSALERHHRAIESIAKGNGELAMAQLGMVGLGRMGAGIGSVIASWLLDLTAQALASDASLEGLAARVSDSGEGRWTLRAAIDEGVPAPVLSAALYERFSSRGEAHFADQLLSAMRGQFGGHHELSTPDGAGARS